MSVVAQPMTLEEYLDDDDGTDTRYKLVSGELIALPPESDLNYRIASLLFATFLQLDVPHYRLRIGLQIAVSGARATARQPDLVVLSATAVEALDTVRMATRTYDNGKRETAIKLISIVASQVKTLEDR